MSQLPYPKITGNNPAEQLAQLRSYLFELIDQLNYILGQIEKEESK